VSEKCDIAVECSIDSAEIDVFNIYLYLFGYYVHYLSKQSLSVDTLYREVDEVRIVHIFLPIDEYYSIPVSGFDTLSLVAVEFVYNDVVHIRETIESFFLQTWPHKEYIIIDGGSTDGTLDIIKEYSYQLAYWCSEKDRGIYDAMNKGIMKASGDWINILNSGDRFYREDTLETVFSGIDVSGVDVLYGNSAELSGKNHRCCRDPIQDNELDCTTRCQRSPARSVR